MIAFDTPKIYRKKRRPAHVPEYLVYEIIDGQPYYYKGYRDVLNKTKTPEEIMGCSCYQWKILEYLLGILFTMYGRARYRIATNEPGLHLDKRNNLAGDILLFDKKDLPGSAVNLKYTAIPALLHIEVDITAATEDEPDIIYIEKKTNKLLVFGTAKIIWIFTKSRRILIATSATNWEWHDWAETLPLIDDVTFNIADYLKEEGIEVD